MIGSPIYKDAPIDWRFLSSNPNGIHLIKDEYIRNNICALINTSFSSQLSSNPSHYAIYLLEKYPELIQWDKLSINKNPRAIVLIEQQLNSGSDNSHWCEYLALNPHAIHLLEKYQIKINWTYLSSNPGAIHLLEANMDKINWSYLSINSSAISLLEQHPDKIDWLNLSVNPNAIHLLEKNINNIYWEGLSCNINASAILEKHLDKVDWKFMSLNRGVISILEKNLDKIHWELLSLNENAVAILERNLDKVHKTFICGNPNAIHLFAQLDYPLMHTKNKAFAEELVSFVCHPKWLNKCASRLNINFIEYQLLLMECNVY
jgi:hypothetical protein